MSARKPRADAVLKNLPAERQEQIAEWCAKPNDTDDNTGKPIASTGGLAFAQRQLAADGIKVSLPTLSEFFSWWQLEQDLEVSFERERQVLEKTGDAKLAREAGEALLMRLGLATQNAKLIVAAAQTSDSRRALDLEEASGQTKARQKERALEQKDVEIQLAERKFRRETCALFLEWSEDQRAKDIASNGASQSDKIEALGRAMFGDKWDA